MDIYADISKYYRVLSNQALSSTISDVTNPNRDSEMDLNEIIGREYEPFWYCRERYRVIRNQKLQHYGILVI